ncbi:hypothetical protein QFZ40_003906 [Arthrobacter pascens]|uniref:hypothetical protein n=1 Tax=Arthrobacter pascens TaxID=1677 RepID=UPI002780A9F0|nr:hypothetical protein [Arthrobacter pascens]MDQ0635997.1 hypothetical protein [Arthrobacter pascens]
MPHSHPAHQGLFWRRPPPSLGIILMRDAKFLPRYQPKIPRPVRIVARMSGKFPEGRTVAASDKQIRGNVREALDRQEPDLIPQEDQAKVLRHTAFQGHESHPSCVPGFGRRP